MFDCILMIISEIIIIFEQLFSDNIISFNTNGTEILGRKLYTIVESTPYVAFWKIPYAEIPTGRLRFMPPKEKQWFNEAYYNYAVPYDETCATGNNEDCLYLSIYMPYYHHESSSAVIVWLNQYSNEHGPDFLIDENVIVVIVSYRTSIFGFLNTEDQFARGNMGAKDILTALKWIRENIVYFNGDMNRVTVIGSGDAANLVASFLISPLAEDLFSRAIVQSGSALSPVDYKPYNFEILNKLYWNFYGAFEKFNRTRLYERLLNATTRELVSVSRELFDSTEVRDYQRLINTFGPTVETSRKTAFIDSSPINKYNMDTVNKEVEVMMGFANLESMHRLSGFANNKKLLKYMNYNFQYLLPFEGRKDEYGSRRYKKIRRKIMDFYFLNGTIGERSLRRYAKYLSDQVIYPVLRQAKLHSLRSSNHVYLYRFSFHGSLNVVWRSTLSNLRLKGATSGDEICYQFRCKLLDDVYTTDDSTERHFIKKIARLLTNFAKYGNPTPDVEDDILGGLKWVPLTPKESLKGVNLGRNLKMVDLPEEKRMKFWDQLRKDFFDDEDFVT